MQNILQRINELDDKRSDTWKQYYALYETFDKVKTDTFSAVVEEFDKYNKCTKKYKKLKELDDMVWEVYDNAVEGINIWVNDDHLFTLDKKLCSTKRVTKNKGTKIAENVCSLCLENHDIKHLIKTTCGHYFGKQCFAALIKHKFLSDETIITCPNCRSCDYSLQQFKYK
jgi:hypothetical protein